MEFVGLMVEMLKLDGLECVLSQLSPTVLSDDGQESPPVEWIYRGIILVIRTYVLSVSKKTVRSSPHPRPTLQSFLEQAF